jgi:endonuclease G
MKPRFLPILAIFILFSSFAIAAPTDCPEHYMGGQAPDLNTVKPADKIQEVCYSGYAVFHSGVTRTPLSSAEHLTAERLSHHVKRNGVFHADPNIPPENRAEVQDYKKSGFDRGHMAPAADMTDQKSMTECFSLANMIPQNPNNNQVLWKGIETTVRDLATNSGDLYVVTGPIFYGAGLKKINNRVTVPTYIYKAVYDSTRGQAAAYLVKNEKGNRYVRISIPELEKVSGIAVFPNLSVEAKKNPLNLPQPKMSRKTSAVEDRDLLPK